MEWAIGISVGLVFCVLFNLLMREMKTNIKRKVMEEIKHNVGPVHKEDTWERS